jgi:hypothetical protein
MEYSLFLNVNTPFLHNLQKGLVQQSCELSPEPQGLPYEAHFSPEV